MKNPVVPRWRVAASALTLLSFTAASAVSVAADQSDNTALTEVVITGSRIAQTGAQAEQPISIISRDQIDKTGIASVGELLQQLTTGGKALNAKFNSSGNFGYPPDGGGIGAGSAQVDLRSLDSKRTLVLVDGIRWVNESSASGVSGSADLNTIPMSIVDHIEVLEDGASAIYGSDAIAGVVNIITRKNFSGVEVAGYTGEYKLGGRTSEGSLTIGGSTDRFRGTMVASYYDQQSISSGDWWQSAYPEPLAGLAAGSSATPQGRMTFCDPRIVNPATTGYCDAAGDMWYDTTLNTGTTNPVWSPGTAANTYHDWSSADRFNYAPFNLLLTPSKRNSIFGSVSYDLGSGVQLYMKGLFNNRTSRNQAAPEPIFVGPFATTGGIADNISISASNPYNPIGIDLIAGDNLGWVTRRPLEGGPRIFSQDVDTRYLSAGLTGDFSAAGGWHWDLNVVDSSNKAVQRFTGGYNLVKLQLALGPLATCQSVPGCVPLDLFGGQGRPITQQMLAYVQATQVDASTQALRLVSANLTGKPFRIGDRSAGVAVGAEHREYDASFNPDPLRQTGESQDSFAAPVAGKYNVNELYAELSLPLLDQLSASTAVRYSDYSTFGSETTYKAGFRWQPLEAFSLRGTYSTGFRAPNLGELYGLTQFGATLVDPCSNVDSSGNATRIAACRAQGVPVGFEQANTQIITFTGGNSALQPEKSDSYTAGAVFSLRGRDGGMTRRFDTEITYYNHKVKGAIQAPDIQALLNACINAGGTDPNLCAGFTRPAAANGNLAPPVDLLANLGQIRTSGVDLKLGWASNPLSFGRLTGDLQVTNVIDYKAVDSQGNVAQRQVGIEVDNSAIPKIRANAQLGWNRGDIGVTWIMRYLDSVKEACSNATVTNVPGCSSGETYHALGTVLYNDAQFEWNNAFKLKSLTLTAGVNNLFSKDPPVCYTCTLNGYDAGTYDLPGSFWNIRLKYGF